VLVGLVVLAFLAAICGIHHGGAIEQQLTGRAGLELERAGGAEATAIADGRDLTVRGRVPTADDRRRAIAALNRLRGARVVRDELEVGAVTRPSERPAAVSAACRRRFGDLFGELRVEFGTRSAELTTASGPQLDRLVELMRGCAGATIEVGGHTDSRSGADFNLILSRERAEAVVAYMVAAGIPAERLSARGYGETSPVADNSTAEGRARNRRIEFEIR
jgi:OOP family OmpA-OmpF porin